MALGANLGERASTLASAVRALQSLPQTRVRAVSAWYANPAVGGPPQPDFLNGVARLRTALAPLALLDALLDIEQRHGRIRQGLRNAPRTLDLDLLWHTLGPVEHPRLCLPHPRIAERAFVLLPWLELDPEATVPGCGRLQDCWLQLGAPTLPAVFRLDPPSGVSDV